MAYATREFLSIAPTGSINVLGVSGGVEPFFCLDTNAQLNQCLNQNENLGIRKNTIKTNETSWHRIHEDLPEWAKITFSKHSI